MTEEYPSNSYRKIPAAKPAKPASIEEKRVEKVVTNEVIRRKKSLGKRFLEVFVGGNSKGVAQYVIMDVLVPAAKDTIADMVREAVERTLFGESRTASRRGSYRSPGGSNYVSYNRFAASPVRTTTREDPRRELSRQEKAEHNFSELVIKTRAEAEEVIDRLGDLIAKYESASVADFYDLGDQPKTYVDDKWGWHDLSGVTISRVHDGYVLNLPRPEPLD